MLIHARGDEVVPVSHSELLYERAAEPRRLLVLEGGDHRSAQHDAEIQAESLRWLARTMH
jgi:putative redox protein